MKKIIYVFITSLLALSLTGCSWDDPQSVANDGVFRIAMMTDLGGVSDQLFNQSTLEGLYELRDETGAQISYVEPKQFSDFEINLDKLADGPSDFIIAVGNITNDALTSVAEKNLDKNFAVVDYAYEGEVPNNVAALMFRAQDSSFIVGYIAGMTTKTNKVGFVGGMRNIVIDQFQYGYEAGVQYAAKERKIPIEVSVQYAESFSDAAKGKAIASRMYADNCDIVFHAAGGVGYGVIEAAKDSNKFVIGVDRDQSYIAPDNVLTSALKKVGTAVKIIARDLMEGKSIGGKNYDFGIKEDCGGIPENHKNMSEEVYQKALELERTIKQDKIVVPYNAETFKTFKDSLT